MLEKGLQHTSSTVVSAANSARTMGSGDLDVFATPSMVALMENAAMLAVAAELPEGSTTVEHLTYQTVPAGRNNFRHGNLTGSGWPQTHFQRCGTRLKGDDRRRDAYPFHRRQREVPIEDLPYRQIGISRAQNAHLW